MRFVMRLSAFILAGTFVGTVQAQVTRFEHRIDPSNPPKDVLPKAPPGKPWSGILAGDDLAAVPEVHFQDFKSVFSMEGHRNLVMAQQEFRKTTAHQIAKIHYLNDTKPDRFMEMLLEGRSDLAGLPFVLGDACRLKAKERTQFAGAVGRVREAQRLQGRSYVFWNEHQRIPENPFGVAAWTQMLGTDPGPYFVEHLANSDAKEATQALARIAIFAPDGWLRQLAREVLQRRDTEPTTEVLLQGLRYPWPAIADRAADAVIQLRRMDLVPELAKMLTEPDPRAPTTREHNGKAEHVVREVVRINHVRNCLLCHPPANTRTGVRPEATEAAKYFVDASMNVLAAEIPAPSQAEYYGSQQFFPDLLVRADATYLRQDFSLMQKPTDAHSATPLQRFDYLVRTRVLNEEEMRAYQESSATRDASSPYHEIAARALRGLGRQVAGDGPTGYVVNAEPSAAEKLFWTIAGGGGLLLLQCALMVGVRRLYRRKPGAGPVV